MLRILVAVLFVSMAMRARPCLALDRTTLLPSLRASVRDDLANYELGPLDDLPLYELDLTLRDDLAAFSLRESIEFTNQTGAPLSDVVLRVFGNAGQERPPITLGSARCVEQACKVSQPDPSSIRLQLAAALPAGTRMHIALELQGALRAISAAENDPMRQSIAGMVSLLSGEPAKDYGLLSLGDGIASLAHFYAVLAQRAGQTWVTAPQKRFGDLGAGGLAFVRASIHAPKGVSVITSGVASPVGADGVHNVRAALVRDFAVVASRVLVQRSRQVGDVSVRAYFLPTDADGGGRALDAAAGALAVFEQRFGTYPYRDLDVVEATLVGGAGGCEFSGLVTVASMLYRPLPLAAGMLGMNNPGSLLEFTTAHEVAHQYWYGLVGSDARQHPFQDEALTQWSAQLYFEQRFGAERAAKEADTQIAMNYRLMRMFGEPDGAVDRPVDAFDSPLAYAGLVYGKGAFLYSALRKHLGDQAFFDALRSYVLRYRFRTAPKFALFDVMGELSGRSRMVRGLVEYWLAQSHGDYDIGAPSAGVLAANGGEQRKRLQLLLTALQAAAGAAKPAAANGGTPSLEQLQGMLNGLNGDAPDVRALQQLLQGGAAAAHSADLPAEVAAPSNERGL